MSEISKKIDAILPQTQCQMCEFPSCKDYADAIAEDKAPIHKCHPGGVEVLQAIAAITSQSPTEHVKTVQTQYKGPSTVVIDEDICIGCTKCITACPTNAIIGAAKKMHTVLPTECTGCDLCIPACPVDCIYPHDLTRATYNKEHARARYQDKKDKIAASEQQERTAHLKNKLSSGSETVSARQAAIKEMLQRAKNK